MVYIYLTCRLSIVTTYINGANKILYKWNALKITHYNHIPTGIAYSNYSVVTNFTYSPGIYLRNQVICNGFNVNAWKKIDFLPTITFKAELSWPYCVTNGGLFHRTLFGYYFWLKLKLTFVQIRIGFLFYRQDCIDIDQNKFGNEDKSLLNGQTFWDSFHHSTGSK